MMRDERVKTEAEKRNQCISLRLRQDEHIAISDHAWRNRTSVSAWLRGLALEELADKGEWENNK